MRLYILLLLSFIAASAFGQFGKNDKPRIDSQQFVSIDEDDSYQIRLEDLEVRDRDDWFYPWGFALQVYTGENYTVQNSTVIPNANFFGRLKVPITVFDGVDYSNEFKFEIEVLPVNDKPVIVAQKNFPSIQQEKNLLIQLGDISITDVDTDPSQFTLVILPSANAYTISGNEITPTRAVSGATNVIISVSDQADVSSQFNFVVNVLPANTPPVITAQEILTINEDETVTFSFSQFSVSDPDNIYPGDFKLTIYAGDHYSFKDKVITPEKNFHGKLLVPVSVSDGVNESNIFGATISVISVNDPPEIIAFEAERLAYDLDGGPKNITEVFEVIEVDNNVITAAEIGFLPNQYRIGNDELSFTQTALIKGHFDIQKGTLTLSGNASAADYREVIRTVQYNYVTIIEPVAENKVVNVRLTDGITYSETKTRLIQTTELQIALDIPTAFTPNGDLANDTWVITPLTVSDDPQNITVRIYNHHGVLLYQASGFQTPWDGKWNGQVLPSGTYFYTISFAKLRSKNSVKGVVSILR